MRCKRLLRLCAILILLGISIPNLHAQQKQMPDNTVSQQTYPGFLPSFYIGARGGYLLKNNDLSSDPAFYLNSGYFGELNFGWRSSNNWFGWNLSVGRLNLERKVPVMNTHGFDLSSLEVLKSTNPNWMWDSATTDQGPFHADTLLIDKKDKKDMKAWYAMTGPEFWFGKNKLQGFISLNAGVGMTHFGYYYRNGNTFPQGSGLYPYYSQPNNAVIGAVNVHPADRPVNYSEYGMSQKAYDDYSKGNEINESEINFMARAAVGIEYFISPKFSIDASASYWYIMTPDWASAKEYKGEVTFVGKAATTGGTPLKGDDYFTPAPGGSGGIIQGRIPYDLKETNEKKNLGLISANIGIKFWLGKKKEAKEPTKIQPVPVKSQPEVHDKSLLVTVKDKPTGYALSSVKVTVTKEGQPFFTGITDANGALDEIKDLKAGNYEIQGVLNGVKTTTAHLDSSDFLGDARVINRQLEHNDPRFTLVGHTIDAKTEGKLPHIKTTLEQVGGGESSYQISDDKGEFRYQLSPQSDFTVYAEQKGYFSNKESVTTKGLDRSKTLYVDLRLKVSPLKKGTSFQLKNIYYDFDKSNIRPDAAKVLDRVYKMLEENPTMEIELSSHTDSRGSDAYNMKLSQERANSAVSYLVSKGIDPSRMVAKGYGETKPVNGCVNGVPCTEDQYQANRRTEIKILHE